LRQKQVQAAHSRTTTTSDDNDSETGGSGMRHISAATHNDKHQACLPMDHYKRLFEDACPNHAYPVTHKIKDYGMMRSFVILGSLTWGVELD
jgi:hypothetical protein